MKIVFLNQQATEGSSHRETGNFGRIYVSELSHLRGKRAGHVCVYPLLEAPAEGSSRASWLLARHVHQQSRPFQVFLVVLSKKENAF